MTAHVHDIPPSETAPIAATAVWCLVCRRPKPFKNRLVAAVSKNRVHGWHGEYLICIGCDTTLATIYVEDPVS